MQSDDRRLGALVAAGQTREAARWLVETMATDVLAFCRAMVRDRATAEDLAQDTFQRAFASLERFRGEASVRTWVLAIARNRCLDHLRRSGRSPYALDDDGASDQRAVDPAPLAPDLLARRASVEQALASLDETARALIVLRFRHGLGYPELAEAFGVKQGTVRMRVSRALATMRAALEAPSAGQAPTRAPAQRSAGLPPPAAPAAAPAPRAGPPPFGARSAPGGARTRRAPSPPPSFAEVLGGALERPTPTFLDRLHALAASPPGG